MNKLNLSVSVLVVAALLTAGLLTDAQAAHHEGGDDIKQLVCVLRPTKDNKARGVVRFTKTNKGIRVNANVNNLEPNAMHAIHIHEFGDATSPDGTSAGGHYNPEGHDHALPEKKMRHAGDLGNLKADANGRARYSITVTNITLAGEKNPIIGRGVVVHAAKDDGGQPTGNAGARIARGVIGIAKPSE
ncbi:MAG: superoxide dismutase family protein [Planctomycetota bacterium]|jgi:Cu-Zn family superoxide dismutase